MKKISKKVKLALASLSGVFLIGCGAKKEDPYLNKSPNAIYNIGHEYLKKGDAKDAIKAFESLSSQYPFNHNTQQSNLELMYAYYLDDNSAMALATTEKYLRLYPQSPEAVYAYYIRGIENFNSGRGFLQRYFPYDMSQHDSVSYNDAFKSFNKVISLYPSSVYADDARRRMIFLKNIMAKYEFNISEYYYQLKAYVASLDRAKEVILRYPRSTSVKPALELLYYDYKNLKLQTLANGVNEVYKVNYGNYITKNK